MVMTVYCRQLGSDFVVFFQKRLAEFQEIAEGEILMG